MDVQLTPGEPPRLAEADDLRRFSVNVAASPDTLPALAEALGGTVAFDGAEHAWVSVEWLIAASGRADSTEWRAGFDGMVAYAAKQGWMRADPAAIRGHVVWQGGGAR